jgi:hypothetical protein
MGAASTQEAATQLAELYEPTQAGASRRKTLTKALEQMRREGEGLGIAMNQFYDSNAIFLEDEAEHGVQTQDDLLVTPHISTFPGCRLPHAWVEETLHKKLLSTHDLAGHGSFTIFYGNGGIAWREAAVQISNQTGIPIQARGIGFGLDFHDSCREWHMVNGVEEDGCVLVRPDRFVAWRAKKHGA